MTNVAPTVIKSFTNIRNVVINLTNNLFSIGEQFDEQIHDGHGHLIDDVR